MARVDNNTSIMSYIKTLRFFGAAYAATQESIKSQATSLAVMQVHLVDIQQFCMAVSQQPPSNIYALAQHQHMSNNH